MKTATRNILAIIASVVLPISVFAESTIKNLHVVDIQQVISESAIGRSAKEKAATELKERQAKLDALQKEVVAAQESLKKQAAVLSRDALEKQREVVAGKETELKRVYEDEREVLARKQESALIKIVKEIDGTISDLAKKNNWDFVLEKDKAFVLYASPAIDVTGEVISSLDKRSRKLEE